MIRSAGTYEPEYRSSASPIAAASAASRDQCSLPVYESSDVPIVADPSASSQPMLTRRSSSGAASVSDRPRTTPVKGETNDRSRGSGSDAGVGVTRRSSRAGGNRHLLVPRKRRRDIHEAGARLAARHPMEMVDGDPESGQRLQCIEGGRGVVIAEHEPMEGHCGCKPSENGVERGR